MFAGKAADREKALLQPFQITRIETQRLEAILDPALRFAQFGHGPLERRQRLVEPPLGPVGGIAQPARGIREHPLGPLIAQRLMGAADIGADLLGGLHQAALRIERLVLAHLGRQRVKLRRRVAQIFLFGPRLGQPDLGIGQRLGGGSGIGDLMNDLGNALANAGVQRIVTLGSAIAVERGLPHDGFYPLTRFMRWVNDEGEP